MKKAAYIVLLALALVGCEQINEPTTHKSTPIPLTRTCLLIDFSGVRCPNCPDAAIVAHKLQESCGEHLIVVEMHPPSNPLTDSPLYDYRCDEADVWYKQRFKCDANTPLPGGAIDLSIHPSGNLYDRSVWDDVLSGEFADMSYLLLTPADTILWVVEDSIIGGQMEGKNFVANYCHNHVLRGRIETLADTTTIRPHEGDSGDHRYVVAVVVDSAKNYINAYKIQIKKIRYNEKNFIP